MAEFECRECGRKVSAPTRTRPHEPCPTCGSQDWRRNVSGFEAR